MLMDADNVILLAQCLSNRYMPVYSFTFVFFLGQGTGQRSWSAKIAQFLVFLYIICFKAQKETRHKKSFNVYLCI